MHLCQNDQLTNSWTSQCLGKSSGKRKMSTPQMPSTPVLLIVKRPSLQPLWVSSSRTLSCDQGRILRDASREKVSLKGGAQGGHSCICRELGTIHSLIHLNALWGTVGSRVHCILELPVWRRYGMWEALRLPSTHELMCGDIIQKCGFLASF